MNSDIRRFMSHEDDPSDPSSTSRRALSPNANVNHSGSISNTNTNLISLYTNKTITPVELKTEYTDLIDRRLPKDSLHLHYIVSDQWKLILQQLHAIDNNIYDFVTKVENSELMTILRENGELNKEKEERERMQNAAMQSPLSPLMKSPVPHLDMKSPILGQGFENPYGMENEYMDQPMISPSSTPDTEKQMEMLMNRLRPRPRSVSTPTSIDHKHKKAVREDSQDTFNEMKHSRNRKDIVSMSAVKKQDMTNAYTYNTPLNVGLVQSKGYTVDTIEPPQLSIMRITDDNQPMRQHRSIHYRPNVTETIRVPAYDPTLSQPIIKSIQWSGDLRFTVMGLLRIFHRLSGIPFVEDGETPDNTTPPPIPRWYYQFCVKSIPINIVQIENMMIDYLQELDYHRSRQDQVVGVDSQFIQQNKAIITERYNIIQTAVDSFITLSNLWGDMIHQWKLEMIREKIGGEAILSEKEMDHFLINHVQVNDVLNVHSKIRDYLGKELLIGCRNLLKLFDDE